jgi:uncharacterized protein HemX
MIAAILSALTSRLAGPIASAVAVALAVALGISQVQLHGARQDRDRYERQATAARADLSTCRSNAKALSASIDAQNRALAGLKAAGDRKAAEAAKALQAAKSEAEKAKRAAAALASFKPAGADLCARMLDVDDKVRSLQ